MNLTLSITNRSLFKHPFLLLVIFIGLLFITATTGAELLSRSSTKTHVALNLIVTQNPPSCCGSDDTKPHVLVGSYYSLKNHFSSKLLLNNKGPRPLEARPTLFSMNGERFDAPPVTIDPESFRMMDILEWVLVAGPQFREGSIEVFHLGRDLVLGSQVYILDEEHSLSFDEKLGEVGAFKSAKLEGVWWQPTHQGDVQLAVSNTTSAPVTVIVRASGHIPERTGYEVVQLASRQTRLLDVQEDVMHHEHGAMSRFGAISVEHSGPIGAVLARGMVLNPDTGYSLAIQFSDPAAAKSTNVQGVGLRLGKVAGETLRPIAIFRNVGSGETAITGRLPYTKENGNSSVINLPTIHLSAGEMEVLDIGHWLDDHGLGQLKAIAGLETSYTGEKGNVIISAISVSANGNQLFRVPMWDVAAQRSATGGYPWYIEGHSSTTVYIKNSENYEQHYYLQLTYPGGVYSLGIKTLAAATSIMFDLRKLRDEQTPDANGNVIPLSASSGQVQWSSVRERGMLLGRSEQVDTKLGYSSNYACMNCCTNNVSHANDHEPRVVADSTVNVGENHTFVAQESLANCYGGAGSYTNVPGVTWTTDDFSVATVGSDGLAHAEGPGETDIIATWFSDHYAFGNNDPPGTWFVEPIAGSGSCEINGSDFQTARAKLTVRPTVGKIQYQSGNDFVDIPGTLYVFKGTSVTFKAIPNPESLPWPSGVPTWSGTAGVSGNGNTKSVTFNTQSSSTNDVKTVIASNGNSVTVSVIVYDLKLNTEHFDPNQPPVLTPADNFNGRNLIRFGVHELLTLSHNIRPSGITPEQLGGLQWVQLTGTGQLIDATSNATGTYRVQDNPGTATLKLKILAGPSKDGGPVQAVSVVAPSDGNETASGSEHYYNWWSCGFTGDIFIFPKDVSFANLYFKEDDVGASASGWLSFLSGVPHGAGPALLIGFGDINSGARVAASAGDRVFSGKYNSAGHGSYSAGTVNWAIPWKYGISGGAYNLIITVNQTATSSQTGRCTITKQGGSTASELSDP